MKNTNIKTVPSVEYLQECFSYNKDTSLLVWKKRPRNHFISDKEFKRWNSRHAGSQAGKKDNHRNQVHINNVLFETHRVIWKIAYLTDSLNIIDHIDGNRQNNKLSNLREASNAENSRNRKTHSNNKLKCKGVSELPSGRFQASITVQYVRTYLGSFDTKEQAHAAYCKAAEELHGDFSNTGAM